MSKENKTYQRAWLVSSIGNGSITDGDAHDAIAAAVKALLKDMREDGADTGHIVFDAYRETHQSGQVIAHTPTT